MGPGEVRLPADHGLHRIEEDRESGIGIGNVTIFFLIISLFAQCFGSGFKLDPYSAALYLCIRTYSVYRSGSVQLKTGGKGFTEKLKSLSYFRTLCMVQYVYLVLFIDVFQRISCQKHIFHRF